MKGNTRRAPLSLLAPGKPPWRAFGASLSIQCVAAMLLAWLPVLLPQRLEARKQYWFTPLATPPVVVWHPQKAQPLPVKPRLVARVETPPPPEVPSPRKVVFVAQQFTSAAPRVVAAKKNPELPPVPDPGNPTPEMRSALLKGSSAMPTLKRPREDVQTGGFGDVNGIPGEGRKDRAANIARLGSYDLPPGPGYGNGSGGARGARGTVASAGFGNFIATSGRGNGPGGGGGVRVGGFAEERPASGGTKPRPASSTASGIQPVEILWKPRPLYTEEARQLRLEGEVVMDVLFAASGQLRVLRLVQGLGHGLDESAVAAAQQIRFRPARRDGQPADTTGTVHILFQLAY